MPKTETGRNHPCPCGSRRKFKHCCAGKAPALCGAPAIPTDPQVLMQAAMDLHRQGRLPDAITVYQHILRSQPDHAEATHMLGVMAQQEGDHTLGVQLIARAIARQPTAEMHYNLGVGLQAQGDLEGAARQYNIAVELNPGYCVAWSNLGAVFQHLGFQDAAVESYVRARDLQPALVSAHSNLGVALNLRGRQQEALACFRQALAIEPADAQSHFGVGVSLQAQGGAHNPEILHNFNTALQHKPAHIAAHCNLIFVMDMDPQFDTQALQAERRRWDAVHGEPLAAKQLPHLNDPNPQRRLRIGYVSADFREHSASKVFGVMLTGYKHDQFEVFAYSNLPVFSKDEQSRSFADAVDHWSDISTMADDVLVAKIRQDGIDILVDLSGYTAGGRLTVFAQRPAPIQVTAWGYATSTGLQCMDVFFADPVMVPPKEKGMYTEEIRYLPSVVSYYSQKVFPPLSALPALRGSGVTFGSVNRLSKVTDLVWDTWIEILHAVPDSKLLVKAIEMDSVTNSDNLRAKFRQAGIAAERLILQGGTDWLTHLGTFSQIDICLDPFPHGGGVTTLEGLKMGVPVVTLNWPTLVGRLSASILTTLGLTDWIVDSREDYIRLAAEKARDLAVLSHLRATLRERFDSSVIGDNAAYVAAVEAEYRQLWLRWCDRQATDVTLNG